MEAITVWYYPTTDELLIWSERLDVGYSENFNPDIPIDVWKWFPDVKKSLIYIGEL